MAKRLVRRGLFRKGEEHKQVHLDWLEDYTPSAMAEAFKVAADRVIDGCDDEVGHVDKFFYPAAYLYRHAVELKLKNIIGQGAFLSPLPQCTTNALGHDLLALWADARRVIVRVFDGSDHTQLKEVDEAIAEVAKIDPDGQGFRYYRDRKGNRNLQAAPRIISLRRLRGGMDELFGFLDGCCVGIEASIEAANYQD